MTPSHRPSRRGTVVVTKKWCDFSSRLYCIRLATKKRYKSPVGQGTKKDLSPGDRCAKWFHHRHLGSRESWQDCPCDQPNPRFLRLCGDFVRLAPLWALLLRWKRQCWECEAQGDWQGGQAHTLLPGAGLKHKTLQKHPKNIKAPHLFAWCFMIFPFFKKGLLIHCHLIPIRLIHSQVTLLGDQDRAEHTQMLYPRHCAQKSWGSECHKDLVLKPSDMSVSLACWFSDVLLSSFHVFLLGISWDPCKSKVFKGQKANIDSYSAFFDNCKANDTGLTQQLENAGVTDAWIASERGVVLFVWKWSKSLTPFLFLTAVFTLLQSNAFTFVHDSHHERSKDVYCCGLVFDICVKSTALHGAEMGFRVSVIEDACKPLSESEVEPTRKLLGEAGVQVISSSHAAEEVKKITGGKLALRDFVESVKPHKRAASHKSETLSSHCPEKNA